MELILIGLEINRTTARKKKSNWIMIKLTKLIPISLEINRIIARNFFWIIIKTKKPYFVCSVKLRKTNSDETEEDQNGDEVHEEVLQWDQREEG